MRPARDRLTSESEPQVPAARRCVVLFTRSGASESRHKGLETFERAFRGMQERVAESALALGVDLVVASADSRADRGRARVVRQRGTDFALRVENALDDVAALGYSEIVVVAGDVPGLGRALLTTAFSALATGVSVLGPSPDGGVYLIGLRADLRASLRGVPWRTAHVFEALRERLPRAEVLASLRDVDSRDDARRLAQDPRVDAGIVALLVQALALPVRRRDGTADTVRCAFPRDAAPARAPPARVLLAR